MHRIVLHAPQARRGGGPLSIGVGASAASAVFLSYFISRCGDDKLQLMDDALRSWPSASTLHLQRPEAIAFLIVVANLCLAGVAWKLLTGQFLEAAMEITPEGVQLVTIYGRRTDGWDAQRSDLSSPSTADYSVSENADPIAHSGSPQIKVRAVIPRDRILDAVVLEVVWSHCVWSQVAFRVLKGSPDNARRSEEVEQITGEMSGNPKALQKKERPSMQELLRQGRVSIVPAFPDECRGMLSYEQCLKVQAEIERLLGLPRNDA